LCAPHHSASASAIIGGSPRLLPREISLAHRGVRFLDALPEFDRRLLESLREPLEGGSITPARVNGRQQLPADFQFIAAMDPCPCGYLGDELERCRCTPPAIDRYRARISGPLLDRIDIRVAVTRQSTAEWMSRNASTYVAHDMDSVTPRQQLCTARRRQLTRAGCPNARLPPARLATDCAIDAAARALLELSQQALRLTGRGLHRLLRVARTIADLRSGEGISAADLAEAIQLRQSL
jgi:magnesium chelatase family protein